MSVIYSSFSRDVSTIRPQLSLRAAKELAERLYGLRVKSIQELNSYHDKNYLVMAEPSCDNPYIPEVSVDGYVLKVLNFMDSQTTHVEAEHQIQALLLKEGFNIPLPVLNVHGKDHSREQVCTETAALNNTNAQEDVSHTINVVRLLIFIPGITFNKIPCMYTAARMYEVGQYIGHLDRVTRHYYHPSLETGSLLDMKNFSKLNNLLHAVTDVEHRGLIVDVLKAFDEVVGPVMDELPTGLIHGDCSDQNLIVSKRPARGDSSSEEEEYYINGLIDFGEMRHTCYVFEAAITIAYMMLETNLDDSLGVGGHVLAGYLTEMELSDLEWRVLKECVAARLATSLVLGAYNFLQAPWNEYLVTTAANGWIRLKHLWLTPKDELYRNWMATVEGYRN